MHDHVIRLTETLVTAPTQPAVTVAYARRHIRSLGTDEDLLIQVWIEAAASYFMEQTGRALTTERRAVWLDAFPRLGADGRHARIELPRPPLQQVVSVEYIDGDGELQSFEDPSTSPATALWRYSAPAGPYANPGIVEPLAGQCWPIAREETGAVRITFDCGYGDGPDDVPELARGILCLLVGHFDTFRAAVHEARQGQILELPYGVQQLIAGFKYSALPTDRALRAYGWHA